MPEKPSNAVENENSNRNAQEHKAIFEMSHLMSKVEAFEENYGIRVSCEKFVKDVEKKIKETRNNNAEVDVANIKKEVFLDTVKEFYTKYTWKMYMEKNEISAEDFETDLLESFHEIIHMYSSTEETVAYFGEIFDLDMSEEQKNQVVYDSLKDLRPVERYKDLYENGELRIRDMRAYAEGLDPSEMSDEEIATALQSAQALREVNASRSVLWRIFHPFRNNAEQRDAKLIEGLISEKITEMQSNHEKNKDFTWYSNFAKTYSPLSEAIDTFGDYVRGVWEDQSEFSDDSNVSEETSQDKVRGNDVMVVSPLKEDEEKNFDNEIKEELNERRSLDIKFENENTDKKSPFIEVNAKDKQVISKDK